MKSFLLLFVIFANLLFSSNINFTYEEKEYNKIFEPYFTTKHQSQGTGLGLYMSYKIVTESLKGELTVSNTKNGAEFKIILPLKMA